MVQEFMVEEVVSREPDARERTGKVLLPALTALAFAGGLFFPPLWFLALALGVAAFLFLRSTDAEYEYTFFDGVLDVAAVYGKARRKELLTARVSDASFYGPADSDGARRRLAGPGVKPWQCHSGRPGAAVYLLAFRGTKGEEYLLFEPGEELRKAMARHLPRGL